MADNEDVQAAASTAEEQAQAQEAAAAQSAVEQGSVAAEDAVDDKGVPWKNRMAEMERRMAKQFQDAMAQQQAMLQQQMAAYAQQFQAPRPAVAEQKQYTDEELLTLANQGHSVALDMLMDRKIAARQQQQQVVQQRVGIAQQQIRTLLARYPEAGVNTSPLGQYIAQTYQGYLAAGHAQTPETVLLAMTTAIADRPELATQTQQRAAAGEGMRTGAVQQHGAIGETTHRVAPRRPGSTYEPTEAEKKLAAAMGVKDPKKARERFIQNNRSGRSAVSTTVSQALGDI